MHVNELLKLFTLSYRKWLCFLVSSRSNNQLFELGRTTESNYCQYYSDLCLKKSLWPALAHPSRKNAHQNFPDPKANSLNILGFFLDQKSKIHTCLFYINLWQRKAASPQFGKAATNNDFIIFA